MIAATTRRDKKRSVRSTHQIPVWLIDDSKYFSNTASSILNESKQVRCTRTFNRSESAIEALQSEENPPEAILLDIEMPGLGGLDAIKPMRELAPSAQILIMTAYDDDDYIRKALSAGASGYLLKNSSGNEYVKAIENAVQGGMPVDPFVMTKMVRMIALERPSRPNPTLTHREREILRLIRDGFDDRQIATRLRMTYNTVLHHTKHIYNKFGVHSRRELIVKALKAHVL